MQRFRIGQKVMIALDNDNDCYNSFRNAVMKVTHVATDSSTHPGYDNSMQGMPLYDLENAKTGEAIPCSLYQYELITV